MADFRLSAQVISRGSGQSAVAAAAYRSGQSLHDSRTDQVHDYSRKSGILHTEILAPDNAPDWMRNREQLWNAVEAAESRKNSQLARELQLSLPHELSHDERVDLVRRYVGEQFVAQGMIADIAIHAPDRRGDQRNHHAHIMLSMRELAGDGFSGKKATPKARAWNSPEQLEAWREQWAAYQNKEFERRGLEVRVDHRSFQRRGIDREPTKHLGPTASQMERSGRQSDIANDNRAIAARNAEREDLNQQAKVLDLQIARAKKEFAQWSAARRAELQSRQLDQSGDVGRKHQTQKNRLEDKLQATYGEHAGKLKKDAADIDARLEAKGARKLIRDVLGRTKADQQERTAVDKTLANIQQRQDEQRGKLARQQEQETAAVRPDQLRQQKAVERGIEKARKRREAEGWASQFQKQADKPPQTPQERPASQASQKTPQTPEREPSPPSQPKSERGRGSGRGHSGRGKGRGSGLEM